MLPTMHMPEANDITGEPVEDPVKCVMSTGRLMTLWPCQNRSTWLLPSHQKDSPWPMCRP